MDTLKQLGADQLLALSKIFNRRWWWTTLLVILGMIFLARLGTWQLDRLEQRRSQNAYELQQWTQSPFTVHTDTLPEDLDTLANRRILIEGRFDYENQVIWGYQTFRDQSGVRLVTPLIFEDSVTQQEKALLVVRGWVPNNRERDWTQYDGEAQASIFGRAFKSQLLPGGAMPSPPSDPELGWSYINIELLQPEMSYELLPFILVQLPEPGRTINDLPIQEIWIPAATEGNHLSYAIQWFSFALIFGFGYLQFILWQERREERIRQAEEGALDENVEGRAELDPTNQPSGSTI
ncbi:MAG: SURF1 family protein [Chloroflexota bacterium]